MKNCKDERECSNITGKPEFAAMANDLARRRRVDFDACAVGWLIEPTQFFCSYLTGCIFLIGLALGCLGVLMMHFLTGGRWGLVLRRPLTAASLTLPLLGVLFVPILFGLPNLYIWTNAAIVASDEVLQKKQGSATYDIVGFPTVRVENPPPLKKEQAG